MRASHRGGPDSVEIVTQTPQGQDQSRTFDAVVVAIKPNHIADLILDKTSELNAILTAIPFRRDRVVVHTDAKLLPRSKRSWGAFNLTIPSSLDQVLGQTTITFWVNRLSVLDKRLPDIFITLNPPLEPDPVRIIQDRIMIHPVATFAGMQAIETLKTFQGGQRIWYAGSFLEIPYLHENAFNTGIAAAEGILLRLGAKP
ncbi:hypothetical protein [Oligoflexus sp.]|uniref:hypothetical protein n=1 Tax=Oligoflexus sp. TaxID=1971216 RepID=UPI002D77E0BC|nr:hypothetical protein [Oligoflexus sp.]